MYLMRSSSEKILPERLQGALLHFRLAEEAGGSHRDDRL